MNDQSAQNTGASRWNHLLAEPFFLFPVIGILMLSAIWGLVIYLLSIERSAVIREAEMSSQQHLETYEAQVFRALREIDQTLRTLQFAHEHDSGDYLADLDDRTMLPPSLLFIVSISDAEGKIVQSTGPDILDDVSDTPYFSQLRQFDDLQISEPQRIQDQDMPFVHFSRSLFSAEGRFDGVAVVSVGVDYFVSAYTENQLGEEGLLAVITSSGSFLAWRSGDVILSGEQVDYRATPFQESGAVSPGVFLAADPIDGVERFTSALEIFAYPLVVMVGISVDEQFAQFLPRRNTYLGWAGLGSVVFIALLAALGHQSVQLQGARLRALAAERAHSAKVEHIALHDSLTGLPNRILFSQLVSQSLLGARRDERMLAVLFMDLDHFKEINDTLGHDAGDEMLIETAKRLTKCFRASDTISRFGGDEFVALMPGLRSADDAVIVAKKILLALANPFLLKGRECHVTASIGIALYPQHGEDEQTLSKKADTAMYNAKRTGRNKYLFYSESASDIA